MLAGSTNTRFEIPSKDFARATRFYEDVLGVKLKPDARCQTMKFLIIPADKRQPTGCSCWFRLWCGATMERCIEDVRLPGSPRSVRPV